MMKGPPNRASALKKYRSLATTYDRRTRWGRTLRLQTIRKLALEHGDVVLDVGCGTGVNFSMIMRAIGPEGRIIGIEMSSEMLEEAHKRIDRHSWHNVELIRGPAEKVEIPVNVDAALFALTHDIVRSRVAVGNVMSSLRIGGRLANLGPKWTEGWALPLNIAVWLIARRYTTTFEGFAQPWEAFADYVPDLQVEPVALGGAYIAWGHRGNPTRPLGT